uniref:Molybdopterin biosynthesis protein n=1 Tax=Erythrocystis saccata TaxID=2822695 RepID=A0A8E6KZZ9_9FLOR|nr:Molybdopterin biosynthesis protein [Erythrocystis saccata]
MTEKLSKEEIELYKKQIQLENIGLEGQKKIKKAKILVIGAGGLGCPILIYLVSSGIGYIGLIDQDKIEKSNLNRQILYTIKDINREKLKAAKKNLHLLNKECKIIIHNYKINEYNKLEIISYYDMVVDATDNFIARHIINDTCYKLNKIYIYGAANKFEGQNGVFNYQDGIKYEDIYRLNAQRLENSCNLQGIIGITTGYIGIGQAIETIKIILGLNKTSKDHINIYNIIKMITTKTEIKRKRNKKNHIELKLDKKKKSNYQIHYKKIIDTNKNLIIDLKNQQEFTKKHIKKAINIPIHKLKLKQTIHLLKKYQTEYGILIYCSNKNKTYLASQLLKKDKIRHKILKSKNKDLIK